MKVLVTGATGFVGNYVVRELIKNNISVIATSENERIAEDSDWYGDVEFIEYDLNKSPLDKNLYRHFNSPEKVIHLAWENLPNYKELFHIEKNLFSNYNFLSRLIKDGLKDITVTGTCLEYGMVNGCLAETMASDPGNSYSTAKDTLRKFLELLQSKNNFLLKWVRLFYIYGKGQSEKSLYSQMEKAVENNDAEFKMSGGEQIRDFLSIEDTAKNISKICLQDSITGIINSCSGKPVSVRSFAENYFSEKNKEIKLLLGCFPYPDYEPFAFWGDRKKLDSVKEIKK